MRSVRPSSNPEAETDLHVIVDDAREWLPEVLARLANQRPRIPVVSAAALEVSYDEVFIKLMRQDEQREGERRG